jgi:hypothetical protein
LGVNDIYLHRSEALAAFDRVLRNEVAKASRGEPAHVWIVACSINGFLLAATGDFDGRRVMKEIVDNKCGLRIMLTRPDMADLRAKQERRRQGAIAKDIADNLDALKRVGVKREDIRYYPGAPTVFAVATTETMLLNPYPYETEGFRCFTLIVEKTSDPEEDIYDQYMRYHFTEPWEQAEEVSQQDWDNPDHSQPITNTPTQPGTQTNQTNS